MDKKKILLLTTGGTIASMPGGEGLEPHRSDVMERELEQLRTYYEITVQDVLCLDSSNIRPAEWQLIARHVFENRAGFDGIVMTDWTSTTPGMASPVGAIRAGNDMIMPGMFFDRIPLLLALRRGTLDPWDLQRCSERIIKVLLESEQGQKQIKDRRRHR